MSIIKKNYEKKMKKSGSRIDKRESNNKNKREEWTIKYFKRKNKNNLYLPMTEHVKKNFFYFLSVLLLLYNY